MLHTAEHILDRPHSTVTSRSASPRRWCVTPAPERWPVRRREEGTSAFRPLRLYLSVSFTTRFMTPAALHPTYSPARSGSPCETHGARFEIQPAYPSAFPCGDWMRRGATGSYVPLWLLGSCRVRTSFSRTCPAGTRGAWAGPSARRRMPGIDRRHRPPRSSRAGR
jgi:hypothetical protein